MNFYDANHYVMENEDYMTLLASEDRLHDSFEEKSSGGEAGDGDIKTERELKDAGKAMKRLSWNIINKDDQPLSTLFKEHSSQSQASSNHKMVGQTNKGITIEDEFPHETRYEISFDVNEPVFSLANVVPVEKIVKKERSKKNEVNEQSAVAEPSLHELPAVCDPIRFEIPLEYEKLSFCKNSVMWETVESWEAFCKMPQNPHFRPLEMSNAKAREGDALGHMVTFSNLAEATCKFQMDDPISDFEETLKALTELESHGFDVQKIRDKLELLMKYKTRRVALKGTSKMVKQKITEINTEYGKYNVEIGEMDKSIREMQESIAKLIEKRESIVANMQKDGSKAMELQKEVDELEESIQDLEHDFYKVVSSSW
ncbi:hypothetical protein GIB67_017845 [Kingdonia uniflora]|uniref:Uncharacterized protein n=2 Tax=Kingdonia uniflora TaxID=39325 RepID=A0A7J7MM59_9MAGN|nr:hypothetical protein GIB67_017845 [Kingdonia uniflora]